MSFLLHPVFTDAEAVANRAYAGKNGNSADRSQRRRLEISRERPEANHWKGSYRAFTNGYARYWTSDSQNFEANPELLATTKYGTRSGVDYWLSHNLYEIADQTTAPNADSKANAITALINSNTDSYGLRRDNYHRIMNAGIFRGIGA
ncbi:putative chitinase [Paraburkholderia sp. WSM4175]|uniref:hypothetical protein n=1 Tax=Paraburkholderia sp. WSM4175 TaxID=2991072 RepID=UPI003D2172C1